MIVGCSSSTMRDRPDASSSVTTRRTPRNACSGMISLDLPVALCLPCGAKKLRPKRLGEEKMRQTILRGLGMAAWLLFALPAAAQTVPVNAMLAKIIDGARREGKLLIRSTPASTLAGPEAQAAAQRGIRKMFGVDLDVEWSPGTAYGPLAAQLYQEMQAGTPASTDVLALNPAQVVPYLEKNLFRTIDWTGAMPSLSPDMVEA